MFLDIYPDICLAELCPELQNYELLQRLVEPTVFYLFIFAYRMSFFLPDTLKLEMCLSNNSDGSQIKSIKKPQQVLLRLSFHL